MRILLLILGFILIYSYCSMAQSIQGWGAYFGTSQFQDSKFSLHHELQLRDHKIFGDHHQTLARIGGQYQFKPYFQGTLGYGFIHSESAGSPNNAFDEHRIYQEALFSHEINKTKHRHRLRLEERFIEGQDFRGRFRYCYFVDIPLTERQFDKNGVYLAVYDEIFLNISDDESLKAFDRNRAYAGVGYKVQKNLGIQLGYMRQNVGKSAGTNHLLLSFHHKLNWK